MRHSLRGAHFIELVWGFGMEELDFATGFSEMVGATASKGEFEVGCLNGAFRIKKPASSARAAIMRNTRAMVMIFRRFLKVLALDLSTMFPPHVEVILTFHSQAPTIPSIPAQCHLHLSEPHTLGAMQMATTSFSNPSRIQFNPLN